MYKKIDVYAYDLAKKENVYLWSTNVCKTIREAIIDCAINYARGAQKNRLYAIDPYSIRAYYA